MNFQNVSEAAIREAFSIRERLGSERVIMIGAGGREFNDVTLFMSVMNPVRHTLNPYMICHGNCTGADKMFGLFAIRYRFSVRSLPAQWQKLGKKAGPIRNQALLDLRPKPNVLVAMPGNDGTADMVMRSRMEGLHVIDVEDLIDQMAVS